MDVTSFWILLGNYPLHNRNLSTGCYRQLRKLWKGSFLKLRDNLLAIPSTKQLKHENNM